MTNIGVNVVETNGSASPAIQGAPTSVAAFLVRTKRGPIEGAAGVTSWGQFVERFGAHYRDNDGANYFGAYAFQGFLANGGTRAVIRRVTGAGSAAAGVTLRSRAESAPALQVTAGYRGSSDPGAWGNGLAVALKDNPKVQARLTVNAAGATPGRLQGTAAGPFNLAGGPHSLTITVAGTAGPTITFDAATGIAPLNAAPAVMVAGLINRTVPAVLATVDDDGRLVLTTRAKGAAATLAVTGAAAAQLGLAGTAVAGADAPGGTPAFVSATVSGLTGFAPGLVVRISDGLTADYRVVKTATATPVAGGGFTYAITWENAVANGYQANSTNISSCEFDLQVLQTQPDGTMARVENWERVTLDPASPQYAPLLINDRYAGSKFVTVADVRTDGTSTGAALPFHGTDGPAAFASPVTLGIGTTSHVRTAGSDGSAPGVPDYQAALASLDLHEVQLVAAPEAMETEMLRAVNRAGTAYCGNRGDCMWVGHVPETADPAAAAEFGKSLQGAKVYGALYWPFVTVSDPLGRSAVPTVNIPPTGHVLGVYARTDSARGVWKAPAGDEAQLQGVLDLTQPITDVDHTMLVKEGSVNGIRFIRGAGIVIDASRTLSTDTRWLYVNVRLLFNFVKSSLKQGLRWVKQEPNRSTLWNAVKYNTIEPFLLGLWRQGAFGTGKPEEVFTVKVDAENNPPDQVDQGNLRVEVYFYPVKPAETIVIEVGQQPGGATAAEA